jgi:hypothetical protein
MDFDDLLRRYFGTAEISDVTPEVQSAGIEHILVDFGLEQDRGKRFALWSLLHLLAAAPDLAVAFKDEADREAARNFMDLFAAAQRE